MGERDFEKLLGGYATGTLSQEERKKLFDAALADQALFDALADEQALKDLLDDPATRRRLLAAMARADEPAELEGKGHRWGALVPAWLQLPAKARPHATVRTTAPSSQRAIPDATTEEPPRVRWAVTGGVIVAFLAVLFAVGLWEENVLIPPSQTEPEDTGRPAVHPQRVPPAPPRAPEPSRAPQAPAATAMEPDASAKPAEDQRAPREPRAKTEAVPPETARTPHKSSRQGSNSPPTSQETAGFRESSAGPRHSPESLSSANPAPPPGEGPAASMAHNGERELSARALFYAGIPQGKASEEPSAADRQSGREERGEGRRLDRPFHPTPGTALQQAMPRGLGVRYSLVRRGRDGKDLEVDPAAVFETGEDVRLTILVNTGGYLYVLRRTPPDQWTVAYPGPGFGVDPAGRAAYVHPGTRYAVPIGHTETDRPSSGPVQLVMVFARDPQPQLGSLGTDSVGTEQSRSARIADYVRRLRIETAGGKLARQRVEPSDPSIPGEHAVYVIDAGANPSPRILADLVVSYR